MVLLECARPALKIRVSLVRFRPWPPFFSHLAVAQLASCLISGELSNIFASARYTTRGELELTAFNSHDGSIKFAVQAGRVTKAHRVGLSSTDMQKLRALFASALQKVQPDTGALVVMR
jgi:hypothetical protein